MSRSADPQESPAVDPVGEWVAWTLIRDKPYVALKPVGHWHGEHPFGTAAKMKDPEACTSGSFHCIQSDRVELQA